MTVDLTVGELTTFVAPTGNFIINTGGGTDLVTVVGLNATLSGGFTVSDPDATRDDTLAFNTTPTSITTGSIDAAVLNVDVNANLNADGFIALGQSSGAGLIRTRNVAITSRSTILFQEPVNLLGATTVSHDNPLAGADVFFDFPVEGPQGLTVSSAGRLEFFDTIGSVTPLSNLELSAPAATGQITVSDVTTTGSQVYNTSVITAATDGAANFIGSSISFLSSIGSFSSPVGDLVIEASDSVALGGLVGLGLFGGSEQFNVVDITSPSGLIVNGDITAASSIFLSTVDNAAPGQDISISGSLSALSLISIDASDSVTIGGGNLITGSLLINADAAPVDPDPGVGATVSLSLVGASLSNPVNTTINTGSDADVFEILANAAYTFTINAADPSSSPGDRYDIDAGGGAVTIDAATNSITLFSSLSVIANGIENLNINNSGGITVTGASTSDVIVVSKNPAVAGGDLITINGRAPIAITNAQILEINGMGGDDFFGYSTTAGPITVPVTFNGGLQDNTTGGDALRIDGSFTTQVLNYTAPGAEGNNGDLVLDGTTVTYTGLEPIVAGNSVDTILNFNTGVANNATLRNNPSAGLIEIVDNGATFEDTQFPNPTNSLTINLGSGGDTLTVEALDAAYAASMIITSVLGLGNVQFNGATISNTPGRGLDVVGVATLGITNSTFSNNTADVGGGLRVVSAGANTATTIDSSTFTNNVATGDLATQGGGAIFDDGGDLIIRNNTVISGNRATGVAGSGGGILFASSETLTVLDSTISNNQANRAGGGIDIQGNLANLTNATIQGNVAGVVAAPGNGGGVHVTSGNLTITGGSISGNTAAAEGGGLWNASVDLTITGGAVISGNFANGDLDPAGALVDLQGGGGIFNDGGTVVINDVGGAVEISGNFATGTTFGSGGGILSTGGSVTITGARISNNAAVRAGGGLEIVEGNVTLINSTIDANRVATQSPITANPGNGGGLHITGGATVTIDGGSVTNNIAEEEGGGLWNSATGTLRVIGLTSPVSITGNIARGDAAPGVDGSAVQGGGGIFNNGGTLFLDGDRVSKNIDISGNAATGATHGSGGGILSVGGDVTINGAAVSGNEAVRAGGGIEVVAGTVTILQTNITDNDVSAANLLNLGLLDGSLGNGGGLHITGAATVVFDGGTVSGNVAALEGGGLWNSLTGTLVIRESLDNTVISNNIAEGNADPTGNLTTLQGGGGVFNNGGSLQFIDGGDNSITISANAATGANFGSGGGILSINGPVDIAGVEINGNEAVRSGGGVEIVDGTFTLSGGQITGNDVSAADLLGFGLGASLGNGGGLHVTGTANVNITSVGITSNVAGREGGGLWNNTGTMNILGLTLIEDNIAQGDAADDGGGGIFNNGGTLVLAADASGSPTLANNSATGLLGSGGGIFNSVGGTLQVTNVTISNNVANRAGGGIEDASGAGFTLLLDGVTMADNNAGVAPAVGAPGNGGGLHVTGASNVRITGGTYSGNTAAREGGALWNGTGTMTIELGTVIDGNTASGNAADDGGGGIFNNGGILRLTDGLVVVSNNIANGALGSGGGIFNNTGGTVVITGSTISGNRANRAGGGIEDASGVGFGVTFTGGLLADNLAGISPAVPSPGIGGGLNVTGASNVTLDGTRVAGNIAATEGGGLNNGAGTMTILNGAIIETNQSRGNNSGDGGGGIFNDQGTLIIQGTSTFIRNNTATGQFGIGGGIASRRGSVSITDATLRDNTANGDGGGLIVRGPNATVSLLRAFILDNTAEDSGGGAFLSGASVTVVSSLIAGNIARGTGTLDGIGGGLFLEGDDTSGDFLISNTTFSNNAADGAGGGVYVLDASGTISNSGLLSNRVTGAGTSFDQGGGGIAIVASTATANVSITDSSVTGNQSPVAAGIAIVDAIVTVLNSTISDNIAGAFGAGGIGVVIGAPIAGNALQLNNSRVQNNSTTGEGGGIGVVNASILVDSSMIQSNQATGGRGGGIGAVGLGVNGTVTLQSTTLFANTSSLSGGGVAIQNMGLDFENVTLSSNIAGTTGGGLAYENSNSALTRQIRFSTFASNAATNGGANIAAIGSSPIDVLATIIADGDVAAVGLLNSLGNNLDSGNTSGFNQPTDLLNTDPLLGPLADNGGAVLTHAISFGSPAIDAGGTSGPAFDARGFTRPIDGDGDGDARFDIGAAEGEGVLPRMSDVAVTKTASTSPVAGGQVTYTIVVSNMNPDAPDDARNVVVTDTLDSALTFESFNPINSSVTQTTGATARDLVFTVGELPFGTTQTFSYVASIASGATGTIPNTAVVTTTDIDAVPTNNTDDETITVDRIFDLIINKTVDKSSAVPGQDTLLYTITVSHDTDSVSDAPAFFVEDVLPVGLSNIVITSTTASGTPSFDSTTRTARVDFTDLPIGETRAFTITATIDATATGNASSAIVNPATVNAGSSELDITNNTANATTTLTPNFDVTVTKTTTSTNVGPGDTVVYSVGVSKSGPSQARGVTFSDAVPTGLTFVSGTLNGVTATASNGTISVPAFNLDNNTPITGTFTFIVNNTAPAGTITNTALVAATGETNTNNNSASAQVTVTPRADVSVLKTVSAANANTGSPLVYTITVSNTGPSTAAGVQVVDTLPAGVTFVSGTGLNGAAVSAPNANRQITISGGDLAANGSFTITINATIDATATGQLVNSVAATTTTPETNTANNSANATTTVAARTASLSGVVFVDNNRDGIFNTGDVGQAGVTVQLTGTDPLGAAVTATQVTATGGTYSFTNLPAGTYTVQRTDKPANLLDGAEQLGVNATAVVNDIDNFFTQLVLANGIQASNFNFGLLSPSTDLSLVSFSSSTIFSGASGFLDFEISNLSAVDATNVVAFFTLDPNVTFASGFAFPGTVTSLPASNQIRVEIPSIAANQSVSVNLAVLARNNLPGGMTLTTSGTVSAAQPDSDSVNNTISASTTVVSARTLSTGAQDGGVVLTVDLFGSMGSGSIGGISLFNPPGALDAAETIFEAGLLIGRNLGGTREVLTSGSFLSGGEIDPALVTTIADLDGTDTRVTSSFMIGSLRFDLVQELLPVFDASGVATGSTLTQTYTVSNTATNATSFDLVRFVHADLLFDGNLEDGGGVLRTANGGIVLFETESSTLPGGDTTFVGISTDGGTIETNNQFQIASFDELGNRVVAGTPLTGVVTGDLDGNGLIDPGQEYDVSLALRNLFQLAAGASTTYTTKTFFGSGTLESVSNPPSSITGHVFCDANGSGVEEAGEAQGNVTVFVDRNGNRVLDSNELSTLTDSSGDFRFTNVPSGAATVAVVVPDGCNTIPRNVGVARTSLDAGKLARSIATVDLDGDLDMDLVVASDLSNSVTVFQNNGGVFSIQETITLSDRPQAISAWSPGSGSTESVIAVAGFGTPSNKGNVFKIADGITESFKAGDGPIALVVDDFNGDLIADVVSVASRSSDLSLTLGRAPTSANSSTVGASQILTGVRNIRAIITGDFNGDGKKDIAVAGLGFGTDANSELKVLLGRGNGTFETSIARAGDREVVDLIATDIDGDGDDELLTLSANGQLKTYRLSARTLSQIAQTSVSIGASSFAVGDFNGDGVTDVAVANLGDELIDLLVGDRTGQFFLKSTVTNVTAPSDIVVADFDGDGKAEIAVANFYKQLPEVVTDQTPRNKLPSTLTILKLNIAEQAVMVTSESTSTVNVTFPSANPATIFDVNRDSFVSAVDALEVISVMRQNDLALLSNAESEQAATHKAGKVVFRAPQRVAADVNGDGRTSALDALMVINYLNQQQLEQLLAATGESLATQPLAYDSPRVNKEDEDKKHVAAIDALFAGGLF